jgi:hypothetical protein
MDTIKFVIEEYIDEEFGYRFPVINIHINDRNLIHLVSMVENKCPVMEAVDDPWGYIGFELSHFERFRNEMLGKKAYPRSVLLTCTCTYPECSCIMADMVFQEKTVVWKKIENPLLAGPTPILWVEAEDALENGWVPLDYAALGPFIFDREQYLAALDDVSKRILPYYYG